LTPEKAIFLAQQFRNFRPNDLEKYLLPTVYDFANELSIQTIIESDAEPILNVFRNLEVGISDELSSTSDIPDQLPNGQRTVVPVLYRQEIEFVENINNFSSASEKRQTTLTNEERRAEILVNAGKIRGC
jgi:hypothetical protein